jgi:hypothetical protein
MAGFSRGIKLQSRDLALLRGLYESRVMTLAHAATLHFAGKQEMAKKRVQKLKAAGFIVEKPRSFASPSILFLGLRAYKFLTTGGHLFDYPPVNVSTWEKRARVSDLTLRHELAVMDVKTALMKAISTTVGFQVMQFSTWPRLNEFEALRRDGLQVRVKPDGFISIREGDSDGYAYEHAFFLEVDRSTESLRVLVDRCHCYLHFYRSGGFARRNGGSVADYKSFPFRVLLVCKSNERVENVAQALYNGTPSIQTQVLLATTDELRANPVGAIWMTTKAFAKGTRKAHLFTDESH